MASSQEVEEPPVDQEKKSSKEKKSLKTKSNSTATTSNSGSAHMTGGRNGSKKAKGKRPECTEQEDPSNDSDSDSHDLEPHAGTSPSEIITEVMGQSLCKTLKIASAFTFTALFKKVNNNVICGKERKRCP